MTIHCSRKRGVQPIGIALVFCWLTASGAATSQEIVVNGEFDSDLSGWTANGPPSPTWSMLDMDGDIQSGSALLSNDAADANVRLYPLRQCIVAPPPGPYYLHAAATIPPSQATTGSLVVSYFVFANSECTDGVFTTGGYFVGHIGAWEVQFASIPLNVPSGPPRSIGIWLGIEKTTAGGVFVGHIDAVSLTFDRLFGDTFELPTP